jgi:hypothetical protein
LIHRTLYIRGACDWLKAHGDADGLLSLLADELQLGLTQSNSVWSYALMSLQMNDRLIARRVRDLLLGFPQHRGEEWYHAGLARAHETVGDAELAKTELQRLQRCRLVLKGLGKRENEPALEFARRETWQRDYGRFFEISLDDPAEKYWVEAEAGSYSKDLVIREVANASGGKLLRSPQIETYWPPLPLASVTVEVTVPEAGRYGLIWRAEGQAHNEHTGEFRINERIHGKLDQRQSRYAHLPAGTHRVTLRFDGRHLHLDALGLERMKTLRKERWEWK